MREGAGSPGRQGQETDQIQQAQTLMNFSEVPKAQIEAVSWVLEGLL